MIASDRVDTFTVIFRHIFILVWPKGVVKIHGTGVISIVIEIGDVAEILMVHKYLANLILGICLIAQSAVISMDARTLHSTLGCDKTLSWDAQSETEAVILSKLIAEWSWEWVFILSMDFMLAWQPRFTRFLLPLVLYKYFKAKISGKKNHITYAHQKSSHNEKFDPTSGSDQ